MVAVWRPFLASLRVSTAFYRPDFEFIMQCHCYRWLCPIRSLIMVLAIHLGIVSLVNIISNDGPMYLLICSFVVDVCGRGHVKFERAMCHQNELDFYYLESLKSIYYGLEIYPEATLVCRLYNPFLRSGFIQVANPTPIIFDSIISMISIHKVLFIGLVFTPVGYYGFAQVYQ